MRFRRIIGTAFAATTLVVTGAVAAGPASASHNSQSISPTCGTTLNITGHAGDVVQVSTTNLQNCFGDGLILQGSNYTVQINGTITGATPANEDPADNAGIRMDNTTRVRVRYGTVMGFDAGVAIVGGQNNTVQAMSLTDNVNEGVGLNTCEFGDGVYIFNSDNNQVLNNRILRNGPFSGASVISPEGSPATGSPSSDGNLIRRNIISNNRASGGCVANLNAGVRLEGPQARYNRVDDNTIERNLFAGVALHEFLSQQGVPELQGGCNPEGTPRTGPVAFHQITRNRVRQNGTTVDPIAGGITMFDIGLGDACASTDNTISGNSLVANIGNGLYLAATSMNNVVENNSFTKNTRDGINVAGQQFSNRFTNVGPTLFDVTNPDLPPYTEGTTADYRVLSGSGSGDVTAQVVAIDPAINDVGGVNTNPVDTSTSGCTIEDYTSNPEWNAGDIALVQRGTCTFAQKVDVAIAAGASAVVLFNEGQAGRQSANFGSAGGVRNIPVLSASYQVGNQLVQADQAGTVTAHIVTNTTNVPFQSASGSENNVIRFNGGTGNARYDGADYNVNCDNNLWANNHFGTVNQECVIANGGTGTVLGPPPTTPLP